MNWQLFEQNFESFVGVNFWTMLFAWANLLIVYLFLSKLLFKPIKNMIDSRQKEIDDMYAAANDAQAQAETMQAEYQQKLSSAQATSERLVKEAMARGQAREEEIIRKANEDAAAIMDKAAADIATEKKKALNDAKDEISGLAMAIAGKVVGRELSDADHSTLIDRFIDELGDQV